MKRLCILVPTYKHKKLVELFIQNHGEICKKNLIDIFFYDSSPDDETLKVVENYKNNGLTNLYHIKYDDEGKQRVGNERYFISANPDFKVFEAQNSLSDQYDYVWLAGDGVVLDLSKMLEKIFGFMEDGADIIHFGNDNKLPIGTIKSITDAKEFYTEYVWHMTLYGGSIVSSKVIKGMNTESNLEKYLDSDFLYVMSIYDYCSNHPFHAVHLQENGVWSASGKSDSGWVYAGKVLDIWAHNWVEANIQLPDYYDSVKKEAIKSQARNSGVMSGNTYLYYRIYNSVTLRKCWQYRKTIPLATDVPLWKFYAACFVPKGMIRWMYSLRLGHKI